MSKTATARKTVAAPTVAAEAAQGRKLIMQSELAELLRLQEAFEKAEQAVAEAKLEHGKALEKVNAMRTAGVPIQFGRLKLEVKVVKGQRRPAWKEVCAEQLGKAFVENIIETTEPGADSEKVRVVANA